MTFSGRARRGLVAAALIHAAGCGDEPRTPASMEKTAGDAQTGTVGAAASVPPTVTIKDSRGRGVPGLAVEFAVASGGGSVTVAATTTDAAGVAKAGSWTLGTTA